MAKNRLPKKHYRNVAGGNSGHGAHAKPSCYRPNPSYAQSRIVNASRPEMRSQRGGLGQRFGRLGALALLGAAGFGVIGCEKSPPEDYDLISKGIIKKISSMPIKIKENELEEGYALPQNIRFEIRDQNQNGKEELVLEYEGRRYLVKYDSIYNRVSLVPYKKNIQLKEDSQ